MENLEVVVISRADHADAIARPEFTSHVLAFIEKHSSR